MDFPPKIRLTRRIRKQETLVRGYTVFYTMHGMAYFGRRHYVQKNQYSSHIIKIFGDLFLKTVLIDVIRFRIDLNLTQKYFVFLSFYIEFFRDKQWSSDLQIKFSLYFK